MENEPEPPGVPRERVSALPELAILALLAGAGAGLVGAVFRRGLELANLWRGQLLTLAHERVTLGLVLVVAISGGATAIAAWLVRRFSKFASGSGIPHVEAVIAGSSPPAHPVLLPVKFLGGLLAIGVGLPLGREGPSVQMGAVISMVVGRVFRRSWPDCRALLAAGAGAGLSTACNAPMAGAVFVLEELVQKFECDRGAGRLGRGYFCGPLSSWL